jgi:hypothetical protein
MKHVLVVSDMEDTGLLPKMVELATKEAAGLKVTTRQYRGAAYKQVDILLDANSIRPDMIVCMGGSVLNHFVPGKQEAAISKLRDDDSMEWQDIPVRMTYSPKFVDKKGGTRSREFEVVVGDLKRFFTPDDQAPQFSFELFEASDYKSFLAKFADSTVTALDYEGSSLEPQVDGFRVGGVGLAKPGYAAYLVFTDYGDLDYKLTQEISDRVGKFLKWMDDRCAAEPDKYELLVFNAKYEVPLTRTAFGQRLSHLTDVMQEYRTLDMGGGLKELSKQLLGVSGWTKPLEHWRDVHTDLLLAIKPTSTGPRPEASPLFEGGIPAVVAFLKAKQEKKTNTRVEKILGLISAALSLGTPFYGEEGAVERLTTYLRRKLSDGSFECNYTEIPKEIVAPYGGADCHNTVRLHLMAKEKLAAAGLTAAAGYYNKQIYLGAEMENNGIIWDDDAVVPVEAEHKAVMIDALREFLLCKNVRAGLTYTKDGSDSSSPIGNQDVVEIQSALTVDKLKEYFNPDSTQPENTDKLGRLLVTPAVRVAMMLHEVNKVYASSADESYKQWPTLTRMISKILSSKTRNRETLAKFGRDLKSVMDAGMLTENELNLLRRFRNWLLPSAESEVIQDIMDSMVTFTGCDLDDRGTWVDDVYPVYYYKLYKKVSKALSSFINGAGGRKAVKIARLDPIDGTYKRLADYFDRPKAEGEVLLYEPKYGVNFAKTKRWTSAYHGIPTMAESKRGFTSRFKHGLLTKCDFSQHELRIISSVCKDANMIDAFRNNKDLHKMVASLLYKVPEEEVNDNQRAVAKAANFGLVYLKTPETFAQEYLAGDVAEAKRVFDAVFTLFPDLKRWRDGQIAGLHKIMDESDGDFVRFPIYTLWGDPIWHEFNRNKKMEVIDAERYSVNWVIQSTASNLAALAAAETSDYLRNKGFKSVLYGFTHDCHETDVNPLELFSVLEQIPAISEDYLFQKFNLPVKIDVEMGGNLNAMVEFKRAKGNLTYFDGDKVVGALDGTQGDVDALVARLSQTHKVRTWDEKMSEKLLSAKTLFSIKGCYYSDIGKIVKKKSCKVELERA